MKKLFVYIAILFSMATCIEPFEFETRNGNKILVVEATITDELEVQKVFLKRASGLDEVNLPPRDYNPNIPFLPVPDLTNYEENADVTIIDDLGNRFEFIEVEPGTYISDGIFAAQSGREYQLQISTSAGETIESDFRTVPGSSQISDLYAERIINDQDEEGMAIYVDGEDTSSKTNYFRYVYEETFKIIAPKWTSREFNVIEERNFELGELPIIEIRPRIQEEQTCYGTENSSEIILTSTTNLEFPKVQQSLVRFISKDNPILTHRYSVLVKQLLLSQAAFQYYERLKSFSKSESVFSEIQPGFLEGNLISLDTDEPVIGYFGVSSVDQERIFFDYEDFFEGEDLPPYFFGYNCDRITSPPLIRVMGCPEPLPIQIRLGLVEFLEFNDGMADIIRACDVSDALTPYLVTSQICGDCTILGSNVKPDFWID